MSTQEYGFGITVELDHQTAIERVTAALKEQGFGVLTTIDVQQTLKQKIDVDFEPYTILGACNPHLAHRALSVEHQLGLLLPCNVIVHRCNNTTHIDIVDPAAMLDVATNPELEAVAAEAKTRLQAVLKALQ